MIHGENKNKIGISRFILKGDEEDHDCSRKIESHCMHLVSRFYSQRTEGVVHRFKILDVKLLLGIWVEDLLEDGT